MVTTTEMEHDIYKRAATHYKKKHNMVVSMRNYDFNKEDKPHVIREFWNDYFGIPQDDFGHFSEIR